MPVTSRSLDVKCPVNIEIKEAASITLHGIKHITKVPLRHCTPHDSVKQVKRVYIVSNNN